MLTANVRLVADNNSRSPNSRVRNLQKPRARMPSQSNAGWYRIRKKCRASCATPKPNRYVAEALMLGPLFGSFLRVLHIAVAGRAVSNGNIKIIYIMNRDQKSRRLRNNITKGALQFCTGKKNQDEEELVYVTFREKFVPNRYIHTKRLSANVRNVTKTV